ncbi:MAG: WYL domain-containing protein [Cyanobacteria bacterium M5B4]|nr:MAG: WYL domain-containing protein [Cyanobacteria bacterium M5B4]
MGRKGFSITLSIREQDKAALEQLAQEFGMTWGARPNISKLIEAIARRRLRIAPNHDWSHDRIDALNQVRMFLIDRGKIELAVQIARILLERSELTLPLRHEIEKFVACPVVPWREKIESYIRRQQPFQLFYQDAAEQVWSFTILYAEFVTHEEREYLDCWCEEPGQGLPELAHNRSLRLDRITDASVVPIPKPWRSGLDCIPVELHLFGGLAHGYRSKGSQDQVNEWLEDFPPVRRVVRQATSIFWLTREVLRYGKDCLIVSPPSVQKCFVNEIEDLHQAYINYEKRTEAFKS